MSAFDEAFAAQAWPALSERFGDTVMLYPMGDAAAEIEIEGAIVDLDDQDRGAGGTVDNDGERIVRMGTIQLPVSVNVAFTSRSSERDQFGITDPNSGEIELWYAMRQKDRNGVTQTIIIQAVNNITTKRTRVKP